MDIIQLQLRAMVLNIISLLIMHVLGLLCFKSVGTKLTPRYVKLFIMIHMFSIILPQGPDLGILSCEHRYSFNTSG